MSKVALETATGQCHAHFLRRVLEHAHRDSIGLLAAMHGARPAHAGCRYRSHGASGVQHLDGALLVRQYEWCLDRLELTIHGYCVTRQYGWERRTETVFSTRPPPPWRRWLRAAPLMALRIHAGAHASGVTVDRAPAHARAGGRDLIVRLDASVQQQLAQAAAAPQRPLLRRLLAWCTRSENDTK